MSVEYALEHRSPFPASWGPPPDEEDRRAGWAASHIRRDQRGRPGRDATHRRAALMRRRYAPSDPSGPEAA